MKMVIINDINGTILYEVEVPEDTLEDQEIKVAVENLVKQGKSLKGANLIEVILEGTHLEGANLAGANLAGANLYRANLAGANLEGANLAEAYLEGADLERADLAWAILEGASFYRANLKGAFLQGTNIERANLEEANLEGASIKKDITLLKGGYFTVTNIGSEQETLEVFNTNQGLYFRRGCFFGNEEKFKTIINNLGDNQIAKFYSYQTEAIKLWFNLN